MKPIWLVFGILVVAVIATIYFTLRWAPGTPAPIIAHETANASASQASSIEITYIANEGVLISADGKQVMIDGLHREYQPAYAFLPSAEREKIETAKPPFDKIDLILVSHMHLDHFHPESVGRHLQHNPKALLVSSQQVVDEIEKNFKDYPSIKSRVTGVTPQWKEKVALKVAGIEFEILRLRHGTGRHATIQNLGHVIKLGGKKLLHIGDADTAVENFEKFNLDEEGIDIAFLPDWFLLGAEEQALVKDHIKPKQIIAVHISPGESEKTTAQIKQAFPNAVAFTTMLEKRLY
ncbi:MAG TPA: MBL fold metallo-hydrolase [Pyrinomonadaceae bacterium]|nr:MBL fold metallo-hydrolase [Pyrinomonadaceae bacterium]